jgi:hypothetical protein
VIASIDLARFPLGVAEREALAALERFRAGPLRRWDSAREYLTLTLRPVQSFGAWGGSDPLGGERSEPRPGPVALITHSRTRPAKAARFFVADRPVVRALEHAEGRLWSDGFLDDPARLDSGTLSLWRDGGWFSESWFARFAIEAARGSWRGVEARDLFAPAVS